LRLANTLLKDRESARDQQNSFSHGYRLIKRL